VYVERLRAEPPHEATSSAGHSPFDPGRAESVRFEDTRLSGGARTGVRATSDGRESFGRGMTPCFANVSFAPRVFSKIPF